MSSCDRCGKKNSSNSKFCAYCGGKIESKPIEKAEVKKESKNRLKEQKPQNQKSNGKKWVTFTVIAVAVVFLILISTGYFGTEFTPEVSGSVTQDIAPKETCRDVQVSYEAQEEYLKTEYYTETVPYTDTECETKELSYNIDNTAFDYNTCNKEEDLCIKYFLGICTEKKTYCVDRSASCSLDLKNLDSEEDGVWTIRHSFYESGTKAVIKTEESSIYLYPQTTKRVSNKIRIISQDESGDANRNIGSCNYKVTDIPTKQVCRDVIKYREVQREREVSAYRPVTRYRTEQQCS